ncbi:aldehyde dehydrogenase family protein [Aciditerrimonas ferrireducens]|uniref:Aldehyde dehydrogenase family protein n=1 Tax=Aciditerrimonas ferrireducens TaxID=667306 RepID=A0ABV6C110_9ACTN|nr:aldehyde dehydrogenase family protein [Aciditerrimonas ferrireducens]MCK4176881.1 aldehyde dehydrogenase family protein [Aciditerrimonas ferrireducens]
MPAAERVLEIRSPATGAHIATVPLPGRREVDLAVAAARRAQVAWAEVGVAERARICHRIGEAIEARLEELARLQTLEQGKPLAESEADVREAATLFHLHAEDVLRLHGETMSASDPRKRMLTFYRPVGTWAIVTPWNFPVLMMAEFVAPGLATGNAHVVKPPAHTAMAVLAAVECFAEAGLPPGLVNVLPGEASVGELLVTHPGIDAIGFIGSSATGERILSVAGMKRTVMECSGNGPFVVCADADVERAAQAAVEGAALCSGQVCCATERVLVHEAVHDEFVAACFERAKGIRLGDPFDPATTLGPLNNEDVAAKMDRHLADARASGAEVLLGGARRPGAPTDLYYEFTLVDRVQPAMAVAREESFGPVVPVLQASSDEELLALANQDALGLQGAVFTRSLDRAFFFAERLQVGQVVVNEANNWWDVAMPFGGAAGTRTGWGRIGGKHTLLEMADLRTMVVHLGA